jgi:plasmid stabilization system protein ParE
MADASQVHLGRDNSPSWRRISRAGFRYYPYGLFFVIEAEEVEVLACFHASREPRRWLDRI